MAELLDYWQIICDHRDKILALIKDTYWFETMNEDGIKVTYRDTDLQGRIFHAETELDISPATAKRYFTPGPNGLRDKIQGEVKEFKVIQEADNYIVAYEVHSSPNMIVQDQDMVCVYGGEDECDFGAYIMGPSVKYRDPPPCPPQSSPRRALQTVLARETMPSTLQDSNSTTVRATKHLAGFIFLRVDGDPNKCVLHGVIQMDLGGMIPVSMVHSFMPPRFLKMIRKVKQCVADKLHEKK